MGKTTSSSQTKLRFPKAIKCDNTPPIKSSKMSRAAPSAEDAFMADLLSGLDNDDFDKFPSSSPPFPLSQPKKPIAKKSGIVAKSLPKKEQEVIKGKSMNESRERKTSMPQRNADIAKSSHSRFNPTVATSKSVHTKTSPTFAPKLQSKPLTTDLRATTPPPQRKALQTVPLNSPRRERERKNSVSPKRKRRDSVSGSNKSKKARISLTSDDLRDLAEGLDMDDDFGDGEDQKEAQGGVQKVVAEKTEQILKVVDVEDLIDDADDWDDFDVSPIKPPRKKSSPVRAAKEKGPSLVQTHLPTVAPKGFSKDEPYFRFRVLSVKNNVEESVKYLTVSRLPILNEPGGPKLTISTGERT
ncbi:hypothetical protein BT69DRAFT_272090 [Atractiella rhizophila]|nr:hypothetical protein BT69DRAFT_272090 [Atractiella rhizophila]